MAGRRGIVARTGAGDRLDSCLRRNDGGGAGVVEEGAGTTGKAIGVREGGRRWLVAFHPPPNLPPERGEG